MTPAVNDVAVDFDQLVAHLETAVFVGDAARIEAAYEYGHHGAVLVSGKTQAKARRRQTAPAGTRPVQIHANNVAFQVAPSFMDFLCSKEKRKEKEKENDKDSLQFSVKRKNKSNWTEKKNEDILEYAGHST